MFDVNFVGYNKNRIGIWNIVLSLDHLSSPFYYKKESTEFSIIDEKVSIIVKSIFVGLLTLPLLGLGGIITFYYLTAKKKLEKIHFIEQDSQNKIQVKGGLSVKLNSQDTLATQDGKFYKKIEWNSDLEKELYYMLRDLDKAVQINSCFEKCLRLFFTDSKDQENIKNWIKNNSLILGNSYFNYIELLNKNNQLKPIVAKNKKAFEAFFKAVSKFAQPVVNQPLKLNEKIRVAIITTHGGGGHLVIARAIDSLFKKNNAVHSVIVDVNEHDRVTDPYSIFTGGAMSASDIYDEVFQKENNPKKARQLWDHTAYIRNYIPDYSMRDVINRIRDIKPHFIISTCHFIADDLRVMHELNVPGVFVHCDYEASHALIPWTAKVDSALVKFLLPSIDPEVRQLVSSMLKADLFQGHEVHTPEQLNQLEKEFAESIDRVFEPFGYPVRLPFHIERNQEVLQQIRSQFNIKTNEKIVLMAMGRQGVGKVMPEYIKQILASDISFDQPVRLLIICGRNTQMKNEISELLMKMPEKTDIKVEAIGYLEENEIANLTKIANLYITKPGGATSAELLAVGIPALLIDPHPWEIGNANQLKRRGLGQDLISKELLPKQIKEILSQVLASYQFNDINWKDRLNDVLDEGIRRHAFFMLAQRHKQALNVA